MIKVALVAMSGEWFFSDAQSKSEIVREHLTLITRFDPWDSGLCTCPAKLTLNPYTGCDHSCIYCYAAGYIPNFSTCRPKTNLIQRLRKEASRLKGEIISLSNSSDPYPQIEAETELTRNCLQILSEQNCRIQIITKSDIVTRDVDLLAKVPSVVSLTITTDDDRIAELIEPRAPPPSARLAAVEALASKNVPVVVRVDPLIPSVNDNPETLIDKLASLGVQQVTVSTLKVDRRIFSRIKARLPEVSATLEPLYFEQGDRIGRYTYLPKAMRLQMLEKVKSLTEKQSMKFGVCREGLSSLSTALCDGSWLLS